MAQYLGGPVTTNGTTRVELVGYPGASTRRVLDSLWAVNLDAITQIFIVELEESGPTYTEIGRLSLPSGQKGHVAVSVTLDATTQRLWIKLGAVKDTTDPVVFPTAFQEP